ncbi:MAG: hypothetical protein A2Y34_08240, partial [Spirochaetes bacterium GWC1_27_15]
MDKKKSAKDIFIEQQVLESEEAMPLDDSPIQLNDLSQTAYSANVPGIMGGSPSPMSSVSASTPKLKKSIPINTMKTSEDMQLEKEPIKIKITGSFFWKKVIVPPNAYVIHTRINKKDPITLGMGLSFRYNPNTDAYLIIPSAMQTIGVVANCISKEKQGINVLAYVQWQIEDFSLAYKKLDFSDSRDPLGIVNAQLREQAEAAIKDKIATMSVEEVLTDKAPIIEELTNRLKLVAEGQKKGEQFVKEGLGIKIITVQIREAIVCSSSLWEDLQSPYRNEQKKKSRISNLEMTDEINKKELETRMQRETREAETNHQIELIKQKKQTETIHIRLNEETQRYDKEQQSIQNKLKLEEQTVISKKEAEERLITLENQLKLNREIEILKQNNQMNEEKLRLELDSIKREVSLQTDKELFSTEEEARLKENIYKIKSKQIELEILLEKKEMELKALYQNHADLIEKQKLDAHLDRKVAEEKSIILVEEERNKLKYQIDEQMVSIEKMKQEIRNMVNNNVLLNDLIKELPAIAANIPQIKDLRIFQSNDKEPLVDNLMAFIQKIISFSQSLGIELPIKKD